MPAEQWAEMLLVSRAADTTTGEPSCLSSDSWVPGTRTTACGGFFVPRGDYIDGRRQFSWSAGTSVLPTADLAIP